MIERHLSTPRVRRQRRLAPISWVRSRAVRAVCAPGAVVGSASCAPVEGYSDVDRQHDPPARRRLAALVCARRTRGRGLMSVAENKDSPHNALAALPVVNAVRQPMRTCWVCTAPVAHFALCWRCGEHRSLSGLADVVAPLVYAVGGTESAATLSDYKNHPIRTRRERSAQAIAQLMSPAVLLHEHCFGAVAGVPVSVRCVVPSLTRRLGVHPLVSIAESVGVVLDPVLIPGRDPRCDRRVTYFDARRRRRGTWDRYGANQATAVTVLVACSNS